jgi:3-deoxy-D-manno-octulosonate 8-phosphate phosphatase (KDO 8-P phosphatase)
MPLAIRQLRARARKIKLLLLDVDGVLTDGRIYYLPRSGGGMFETKTFHSRDGLGLRLAREGGLKTGIISGRSSPAVEFRARELEIDFVQEGALEKIAPYEKILHAANLRDEEICYVGDDIVDLPILRRAGLAVGVADSDPLLRRFVHYLTRQPGGRGAVREIIELILHAQDKWDSVSERFLK